MATFLLVHGAWHGGWCWADTEKALRAMGHETHAPTMTGLGELSHLLRKDISPDDHVQDILGVIQWRGLKDIILVGHSYGGSIITGVAGQVPERLAGMVYLDAFVPEVSGFSLFAQRNPERMANFQRQIDAGAEGLEPDLFDMWTSDPAKKDWLKSLCTPHPVAGFTEGVTLTGREAEVARKMYIYCAQNQPSAFGAEYQKVTGRDGWVTAEMDCLHDAMVEDPGGLAALLDGFTRP